MQLYVSSRLQNARVKMKENESGECVITELFLKYFWGGQNRDNHLRGLSSESTIIICSLAVTF